ncbi:MAG: hypothetical protein ACOC8N_07500 [Spirochaetota bacterium]
MWISRPARPRAAASLLLAAVVFGAGCACLDPARRYEAFPGTARIVEVADSAYNPTGKNEFVDIYFDFIPADPTAPERYRYPGWADTHQRLFINHRGNLLRAWVEETGLEVGDEYPAVRRERIRGGGSPVVFEVAFGGGGQ